MLTSHIRASAQLMRGFLKPLVHVPEVAALEVVNEDEGQLHNDFWLLSPNLATDLEFATYLYLKMMLLRMKRNLRKRQSPKVPRESDRKSWRYWHERHFELHIKIKWLNSKKVLMTSKNISNPEKHYLKLAIMAFRPYKQGQFKVICTWLSEKAKRKLKHLRCWLWPLALWQELVVD